MSEYCSKLERGAIAGASASVLDSVARALLGTLSYVDRDRIGVIGICGRGGFALSATSVDPRIKAVATAPMRRSRRHSRSRSRTDWTRSPASSSSTT